MTVFVVSPHLTGAGDEADQLFTQMNFALREYATVCYVETAHSAWSSQPSSIDAVVLANPAEGEPLPEAVQVLLERAVETGAVVELVAMTADRRHPPELVELQQSYDVLEQLAQRSLPVGDLSVLGRDLAVRVLARVQPTLTKGGLRLFLCHRRADGETSCRSLDRALSARHEHVFRDLVDIQDGEPAQDMIEEALREADVMIFLDTPLAGQSLWVEKELQIALGRQIPVVWVRLGRPSDSRAPLQVQPAGRSHLTYEDVDGEPLNWDRVADDVLGKAFMLAQQNVLAAYQNFARIRRYATNLGMRVETLDQRQFIYALVEMGEPGEGRAALPRRPRTDLVQVFGHRPDETDMKRLVAWLNDNKYGPHEGTCRAFDAAVLLDPLPRPLLVQVDGGLAVDHGPTYASRLAPVPAPTPERSGGPSRSLLLLGAFPEGMDSHEPLKRALHAFASRWLTHGGSIVFGGHPTFTPMVLQLGQQMLGQIAAERITVYQSTFWATSTAAQAWSGLSHVEIVESVDNSRSRSLTAMRHRMITDRRLDVAVAIGGRTSEGGRHIPGIDEEISLTMTAGVPVYLLGAAGGRTAELASGFTGNGWPQAMNAWGAEDNEWLRSTEDFDEAADRLWSQG